MSVEFALPAGVEATEPPTVRDGVRLMVARPDGIEHTRFSTFARHLRPGDVVVVNTSGTLAARLPGRRGTQPVSVHVSALLDDGGWVVELRSAGADAVGPLADVAPGDVVALPDGVRLTIGEPHPEGQTRLWRAGGRPAGPAAGYLARRGSPVRYAYVPHAQPLEAYQTVFAREPGSAEMPSAGRPFTDRLVTDLVTRGVAVAPITLHTGVSSQEPGEPPQAEPFRVLASTVRQIESARAAGGRVVAVGTTVTRALESATDGRGVLHPAAGWTELVLGAHHPARVVTGLVTGWHAPGASHLDLLEAVAGRELVERAYDAAVRERYLWHEFGDSCLLLP